MKVHRANIHICHRLNISTVWATSIAAMLSADCSFSLQLSICCNASMRLEVLEAKATSSTWDTYSRPVEDRLKDAGTTFHPRLSKLYQSTKIGHLKLCWSNMYHLVFANNTTSISRWFTFLVFGCFCNPLPQSFTVGACETLQLVTALHRQAARVSQLLQLEIEILRSSWRWVSCFGLRLLGSTFWAPVCWSSMFLRLETAACLPLGWIHSHSSPSTRCPLRACRACSWRSKLNIGLMVIFMDHFWGQVARVSTDQF